MVVVNKVDSAAPQDVQRVLDDVRVGQPARDRDRAESPVTLDAGPDLAGKRVLVVEDGPTLTHGGMSFGAGTVAARQAGAAELVDPRPWAWARSPTTLRPLPADRSRAARDGLRRRAARASSRRRSTASNATSSSPARRSTSAALISTRHPIRHARYELRERGTARPWPTCSRRSCCSRPAQPDAGARSEPR